MIEKKNRRRSRRQQYSTRFWRPSVECLEARHLLAAESFTTNPIQPLDVDQNSRVTALDALRVINQLARVGSEAEPDPGEYFDVNGSGDVSALDALLVINALSRGPILAGRLVDDTGAAGRAQFDLVTQSYALQFQLTNSSPQTKVEVRIGGAEGSPRFDLTNRFQDETLLLTPQLIDQIAGAPLSEGDHQFEFFVNDRTQTEFVITVDRQAPTLQLLSSQTLRETTDTLAIEFDEPLSDPIFDPQVFQIAGAQSSVELIDYVMESGLRGSLILSEDLPDDEFELSISGDISDVAGNRVTSVLPFEVVDPPGISSVSPRNGEEMVSVTREAIIRFDEQIDPATLTHESFQVLANSAPIPGRIAVSRTERFATFYFDQPLPPSTAIQIALDGDRIMGRDGLTLDADNDNFQGGRRIIEYRTLPLTRIKNTNVFGFVRDSMSGEPIAGATIRVDAFPEANAVTDETGRFVLQDMPAPDFFVHIDGSTSTNTPEGFRYPVVGKPFHSLPGAEIQLSMDGEPFDIFLPPISLDEAQTLSTTDASAIVFGEQTVSQLPQIFPDVDPTLWEVMELSIPANSAIDENGVPATEAQIVPVPPDRIPAPLPTGMDPTFVVSIQVPGATTFDEPAPITFPNTTGLAPGEQSLIWSFNHDSGNWEVIGTGTVTQDGRAIQSDPGVGILAPGWHIECQGTQGSGGPPPPFPPPPPVPPFDDRDVDRDRLPDREDPDDDNDGIADRDDNDDDNDGIVDLDDVDHLRPAIFEIGIDVQGSVPSFELGYTYEAMFPGLIVENGQTPIFETQKRNFSTELFRTTFQLDTNSFLAGLARSLTGSIEIVSASARIEGNLAPSATTPGVTVEKGETSADLVLPGISVAGASLTTKSSGLICQLAAHVGGLANLCGVGVTISAGLAIEGGVGIGLERISVPLPDRDGDGTSDPAEESFTTRFALSIPGPFIALDLGAIQVTGFLREISNTSVSSASEKRQAESEAITSDTAAVKPLSTSFGFGNDTRSYYRFFPVNEGIQLAGRTNPLGEFSTVLPPNQDFNLFLYEPSKNLSTVSAVRTSRSGDTTEITIVRQTVGGVDTDGDGVPDVGEAAIGTRIDHSDSDADGIDDGSELAQGTDPLNGLSFPVGLVASLELAGQVEHIESGVFEFETQTRSIGLAATGSHGLAIVDTSRFDQPVALGQIDLQGNATDVAVDTDLKIAVVATGQAGVQFVDVSDPMMPALIQRSHVTATQVEVVNGIAYASSGSGLVSFDLATGLEITRHPISSASITGLARAGRFLYAMDSNRVLSIAEIDGVTLQSRGAIALPQGAGKLFVDQGIAYVASIESYFRGGFSTVDVSNPDNPILISESDVVSPFVAPGTAIATNGSGLGVLLGTPDRSNAHLVQVLNVSDPNQTNSFLTQFALPESPRAVTLASGLAFVAGGTGGFHVVNYLPFDNQGIAPTVSIASDAVDIDPAATGIQIEEGSSIPVAVELNDDVQIRNVELLVNGAVVDNDVSAPFDFIVTAPAIASEVESLTLQVRAFDTGGNSSLSNLLVFGLTEDITSPTIVGTTPENQKAGVDLSSFSLFLSEGVDTSSIDLDKISLVDLGDDGLIGGGDDHPLPISDVSTSFERRITVFTESPLPSGNYRAVIAEGAFTDVAGNAFGNEFDFSFASYESAPNTVFWIGSDGEWTNGSNWSNGAIPTVDTNVVINRQGRDLTITIPAGSYELGDVFSEERLELTGSSVEVIGNVVAENEFSATNSAITARGPLGVLSLNDQAELNNTSLLAADQGVIVAGQGVFDATSSRTIRADGAGSSIDLAGLATMTGPSSSFSSLNISAINGGAVTLPANISRNVKLEVDVQSTLDTSAVTEIDAVTVDATGAFALSFPNLQRIVNSSLLATGGAQLSFPMATEYVGGSSRTIRADGAGSSIDLAGLATMTGPAGSFTSLAISAINGGTVTLPANISRNVRLEVDAQSTLDTAAVTEIDAVTVDVTGAFALSFPNLQRIVNSSLLATDGAQLSFPMATEYVGGSSRTIRADGAGSSIDLAGLTTMTGPAGSFTSLAISAINGGTVTLPANISRNVRLEVDAQSVLDASAVTDLTDADIGADGATSIVFGSLTRIVDVNLVALNGSQISIPVAIEFQSGVANTIRAEGAGSKIDLSTLTGLVGSTNPLFNELVVDATSGGQIDLPATLSRAVELRIDGDSTLDMSQVTEMNGVVLVANGPTDLVLNNLTSLIDVDLIAMAGAQIQIPSAIDYQGGVANRIHADGSGSHIDISGMTALLGSTNPLFNELIVDATNGGRIDLPARLDRPIELRVDESGTLDVSHVAQMNQTRISLDGLINLTFSALEEMANVDLIARGGAKISAPVATQYEGGFSNTIQADGLGSSIALGSLTSVIGSNNSSSLLLVEAINGGTIILSGNVAQNVSLSVDGDDSMFDVSGVTSLNDTNLSVRSGAQMAFVGLLSFTATSSNLVESVGLGSCLSVANVTDLDDAVIEMLNGGQVKFL